VIGTHNSPSSAELLRTLGAKPVMLDLLDARAVRKVVLENEPEAIVHQATALANVKFSRNMDKVTAKTSELRTKGTDALLSAASEVGVRRFVAQSVAAFSRYAREGGPVKTENDPLDSTPPKNFHQSAAAMDYLEQAVTDFGGVALRYGAFYGAANDGTIEPVRKRQFPIVGDGGGIWSWIHLDDAAAATVLALEHDGPAIYNIVDDDPAAVREWLPVLAQALGAKPPRRSPPGSRGCSQARLWLCSPPRPGVPRTRRPSASSAGRRATRPGARDSRRSTRRSPSPTDRSLTRLHIQATRPARTGANRT
jgi:nucleoside-diphosphate-sugar epimerase